MGLWVGIVTAGDPRVAAVSSFQLPASRFQLTASGFQLPASGFQLSASRFQLPASRFGLPAPSFQLRASGFQSPSGSEERGRELDRYGRRRVAGRVPLEDERDR